MTINSAQARLLSNSCLAGLSVLAVASAARAQSAPGEVSGIQVIGAPSRSVPPPEIPQP